MRLVIAVLLRAAIIAVFHISGLISGDYDTRAIIQTLVLLNILSTWLPAAAECNLGFGFQSKYLGVMQTAAQRTFKKFL